MTHSLYRDCSLILSFSLCVALFLSIYLSISFTMCCVRAFTDFRLLCLLHELNHNSVSRTILTILLNITSGVIQINKHTCTFVAYLLFMHYKRDHLANTRINDKFRIKYNVTSDATMFLLCAHVCTCKFTENERKNII